MKRGKGFSLLCAYVALLVSAAAAQEKKTLRSTAAALSAAGGADIVFPLRSALGPADGAAAGPSTQAVDLSALTTPGLRLDNTARRSLGLAARLTRLGPCTGLGPYVPSAPGLMYVLDTGAAVPARVEVGVALVPAGNGSAAHVSHPAAPGDAAALWPGVTGYISNGGCEPVELLAVFGGDDGGLVFPGAAWAAGGPGPRAQTGDDGGRFVVEGCECGGAAGKKAAGPPAPTAKAAPPPKA